MMKLQISQRDVYLILWHDIDFFFLSETDGTTGAGKASGKNLLEVSRNVCKKAINAMVVDIFQLKLLNWSAHRLLLAWLTINIPDVSIPHKSVYFSIACNYFNHAEEIPSIAPNHRNVGVSFAIKMKLPQGITTLEAADCSEKNWFTVS